MTAEQLVVGNKYVPFQKTIGDDFSESVFKRENLSYLYYKRQNSSGKHVFAKTMDTGGDYYNPEDVYEYIESYNGICRGDLVVIRENGYTYSTFTSAFEKLNFNDLNINPKWENGTIGTVFGLLHNSSRDVMAALKDDHGNQCLIEVCGIKFAVQPTTDFVLPEKWAIEINPDNVDMLVDWRGFGIVNSDDGFYMLCDIPEGRDASVTRGYVSRTLLSGYTLITTEQFKQYVLNQTPTDMPTQEQTPQTETKQYPKTPEGLYDMTMDMLNLEPGDIVKVTHKTPNHYMGWKNGWANNMDATIGNEYEVRYIDDTRYGITLKDQPYNFPPYSLEFVRKGGREESYHISNTIGKLKYGADAVVKFDEPVTKLCASDVYWLAKLFVRQNRKSELRLEEL